MAADVALAMQAQPVVRFFRWQPPAVSLGWKQSPPAWIQALASECVVERPTGGALAVHGSDVSVAIVVPRTSATSLHALLKAACGSALALCRSFGVPAQPLWESTARAALTYCLAEESPYAVCVGDRKVAGFAARRYTKSCLIQGSLLVQEIPSALREVMPASIAQQYDQRAVPLTEAADAELSEAVVIERWVASWATWWEQSDDAV